MVNELVKYKDYGIEKTKAGQLAAFFNPVLEKCAALEIETNLLNSEIEKEGLTKKTCKKAKAVRMKYVKVRTETAKIHKEQKAGVRKIGLFLDGWKNAQLLACQGQEKKLKEIEDYFLNLEKERLEAERKKQEALQEERASELRKYEAFVPAEAYTMSDVIWEGYLKGVKLSFENKKLLEKQAREQREKLEREAEIKRLEAERISKLEKLRLRETSKLVNYIADYDNLRFGEMSDEVYKNLCDVAMKKRKEEMEKLAKIEAENKRLIIEAERIERERLEAERIKKAENDAKLAKIEAENKRLIIEAERIERERLEAERIKKAENDAKLAKIEAEKLKLKKELELKKQAELAKLAKIEAEKQAELRKGDIERINDLIKDLWAIQNKFSFKSERNKEMFENVKFRISEMINLIEGV